MIDLDLPNLCSIKSKGKSFEDAHIVTLTGTCVSCYVAKSKDIPHMITVNLPISFVYNITSSITSESINFLLNRR